MDFEENTSELNKSLKHFVIALGEPYTKKNNNF